MLVTTLEADNFLGRILTGRIESGAVTVNRQIKALIARRQDDREGPRHQAAGLPRPGPRAGGDAPKPATSSPLPVCRRPRSPTRCATSTVDEPIPSHPIDPPTLAMTISVNDCPLAGREGDKVQIRVIRDRLMREAEGNVALKVTETGDGDFEVAGRGELQLGVLIEIHAPRRL